MQTHSSSPVQDRAGQGKEAGTTHAAQNQHQSSDARQRAASNERKRKGAYCVVLGPDVDDSRARERAHDRPHRVVLRAHQPDTDQCTVSESPSRRAGERQSLPQDLAGHRHAALAESARQGTHTPQMSAHAANQRVLIVRQREHRGRKDLDDLAKGAAPDVDRVLSLLLRACERHPTSDVNEGR